MSKNIRSQPFLCLGGESLRPIPHFPMMESFYFHGAAINQTEGRFSKKTNLFKIWKRIDGKNVCLMYDFSSEYINVAMVRLIDKDEMDKFSKCIK
jgi:hypothetical protein